MKNKNKKKRKTCIYCKENGVINHNGIVFINDIELGPGWICEECVKDTLREQSELYFEVLDENERLQEELSSKTPSILKKIKKLVRKIIGG